MHPGERFNILSHAVGAVLAAVCGAFLVVVAAQDGDWRKTASCAVYASTLLLLYLASTLYHGARGAARDLLRKIDHCAIYLLIAGTYTPFALVTFRGAPGWTLFGVVWSLALFGILQELFCARGARVLSLVIHLVMGWLAVLAAGPLIDALGRAGFAWLAAGGLFYTGGIVFYANDHKLRNAHGFWHLAVLAGSACHDIVFVLHVA